MSDTEENINISVNNSPSVILIIILLIFFIATASFTALFVINLLNFNNCENSTNSFICPSVNCPYSKNCCTLGSQAECDEDPEQKDLPLCGTNPDMLPNDKNIISYNTCFYPYYESDITNLNSDMKNKIEEECLQLVGKDKKVSKSIFAYSWKKDKIYSDYTVPKSE